MPESTECGCSDEDPDPVFPESRLAPRCMMTFDDPCRGGVGKLESIEVDTEDMGLVEQVSSPMSLSKLS